MKQKKTANKLTKSEPIVVLSSNTTEGKMLAIQTTAKALLELAQAINGINVSANISHCEINSHGENGTGIEING